MTSRSQPNASRSPFPTARLVVAFFAALLLLTSCGVLDRGENRTDEPSSQSGDLGQSSSADLQVATDSLPSSSLPSSATSVSVASPQVGADSLAQPDSLTLGALGNPSASSDTGGTQGQDGSSPGLSVPGTEAGPVSDSATAQTDPLSSVIDSPRLRHVSARVFWTLVVIGLTALFIQALTFVLEALSERNAEQRLFFKRLVPLARLASWILAVWVITWIVWAVDTQGLLAAGAAGAVAIGFASQDVLKNVFGGLVIIFDHPFQAGDKIRVGETYGEVVSVGLWSTRIATPDDNLVSVPNSQVVNGQVSNANAGALDCQVVTDLYLPGWVDERLAKKIAYEAAASSPYVYLKKPIVVLVLDQFKDVFYTHLKVKAYVLDTRFEFLLMSDVTERARDEFRKHGLIGPNYGAKAVLPVQPAPTSPENPGGTQ